MKEKIDKIFDELYNVLPYFLFFALVLATILLSYSEFEREILQKENKDLRQELNIKNGDNWEKQIQQNMEKDQPIIY